MIYGEIVYKADRVISQYSFGCQHLDEPYCSSHWWFKFYSAEIFCLCLHWIPYEHGLSVFGKFSKWPYYAFWSEFIKQDLLATTWQASLLQRTYFSVKFIFEQSAMKTALLAQEFDWKWKETNKYYSPSFVLENAY